MSLSNPRGQSPVRKYFKVRASTGHVVYYDKSQSKEIEVALPFNFIVLDVLNTVGGFHEPSSSGIWSNEVRNSTTDVLRVRTKNGLLIDGPYNAIKDRLKSLGGKFANSVYIAYREGDEWALGNIMFIGASVSEWFDFGKGRSFDSDPGVSISDKWDFRTKGRTEFYVPKFEGVTVPADVLNIASGLDRDLQAYLNTSLTRADTAEPDRPEQPTSDPWASSAAQPSTTFGGPIRPEAPF